MAIYKHCYSITTHRFTGMFFVMLTISMCFGPLRINHKVQHYILRDRIHSICQHSDLATNWTAKLGFNPYQTHPHPGLVLTLLLFNGFPILFPGVAEWQA
jgi:hypothetical protein